MLLMGLDIRIEHTMMPVPFEMRGKDYFLIELRRTLKQPNYSLRTLDTRV